MTMSPRRWSLLSPTYKHHLCSKAASASVETATAIGGGRSFRKKSSSSASTWRASNTASCSSRSVFATAAAAAASAATDTAATTTTSSRRLSSSSSSSGSKTPSPPDAPNTTIIYQQLQRPSFPSVVAAVGIISTAAVLLGRWGYGRIFGGEGKNEDDSTFIRISNTPRTDRSKVTIVLPSPSSSSTSSTTTATTTTTAGSSTSTDSSPQVVQQDVDLQDLYRFLQDQREFLQSQKRLTKRRTREILHQEFNVALEDCHDRGIQRFADWYFSYTTTYKLMSRAMKTAASHAVSFHKRREDKQASMQEAVQHDLQRLICEKYQVLVLRPTITDPKLHRAVIRTLQTLLSTDDGDDSDNNGEGGIPTIQAKIDESMRQFIQNQQKTQQQQQQQQQEQQHPPTDDSSAYSLPSISSNTINTTPVPTTTIPPDAVVLDLDWSTQLQKAQHIPLAYEKAPKELSVALVGGGGVIAAAGGAAAVASKGVGAATAGAAVVKSAGGTAIKTLSAKLSAPFAAKAVGTTLGGKAAAAAGAAGSGAGAAATAASTAAGAAVGGPVGAAIGGALVGVAVDMTLNKGLELIQRDNFVNDVHESLDATQLEWEERIIPELDRTIDESWFQPIEVSLQKQQAMIVDRINNTSSTNSSTSSNTKDHQSELKSETTTTTTTTSDGEEI
eukprot:CAMPEP_0113464520 /NCGR_PEP_ID=MMETSP0014_2-20120614/13244_1 /TAXON_ID=2857 /ORGANISM="Nitzschia sp." /LENGTH=671 /DNA_ID=CAMNT_0000356605 /DNA_START=17 /DNA_END=2032 /DNA_ORIENTATION=+ /assembly_acc=CAM_ASM_000159